jgi:hypothetical protein
MPFSAATGRSEAALAAEATSSDQRQASSAQARVNLSKATIKRPDRVFNSPLETGEDMKAFSPVKPCRAAAKCF